MSEADTARTDATYRLLVEAVIDYAIFLLDTEGLVASWNRGAHCLTGHTAEEIIGTSFAEFYTEEDRRLGRPEVMLETARQGGRAEAEGWRLRKDGTRFWAHAVLDAVHDDAGRLIGFAKITRDMTKRHEAEVALRESERRFRLLVQGVTDYAIFMLDPEGRVIDWNTGAQRIKGYAAQEIIGQHFSRFYTEEDRATGLPRRALEQAATTGRFESEGWRVRKDGRYFWASVVIDAVRDENGVLVGFAKVTRDITERHEAQRANDEIREQMAQLQRLEALGQLTAGIAHNFSNLIQIIQSGIRLANALAGGNDQLKRILADMAAATQQRAGLTEHLLAFSQHHPAEPELVDVASQIREVADLVSRSLRGNIRVQLNLDDDLWPIRVDTTQFELALLNVALNARDAMPDGGQLAISARNVTLNDGSDGISGRAVSIHLRDSGVGIPRGVLGRVLEPFFTTKPRGEGTGLGLSQAYGFAEQAGGTLRIQSTPGQGTEVTFLLPAVSEHDATDAASPVAVSGLAGSTGG
ncbi:histidine kinase [Siccirubricoccus deserti]|uniref:histidine kinase n=1 Tax=Siccirubricoccus deserti TaxID=2013562 RepID=A0A9X0UC02_9PROT|nr:PAS domain-containing sensor histidine kinase [Siccirubricoccus deserti]MBC4013843.1 PAS domain S-box protein [Siccirubricoccus deserti]GGC29929.1 histidine kinase [Siccirubricoccus deserti]